MKTKFSEILKIKKQKVFETEQQLAAKRAQRETLMTQIAEILSGIDQFSFPKKGDYSSMQSARFGLEFLYRDKEQKENMLKYLDMEIDDLNAIYKEANIEYEKIKHLHRTEEEMMIEKLLKEESRRMDEIANQLFVRRNRSEENYE